MSIGHWGTHVVNGAIYELPCHVLNDFEPVSFVATNPQLIVSKKTVPAKDLKRADRLAQGERRDRDAGNRRPWQHLPCTKVHARL